MQIRALCSNRNVTYSIHLSYTNYKTIFFFKYGRLKRIADGTEAVCVHPCFISKIMFYILMRFRYETKSIKHKILYK